MGALMNLDGIVAETWWGPESKEEDHVAKDQDWALPLPV